MNKDFWDTYYNNDNKKVPPSSFATFLAEETDYMKSSKVILDIGCGNGRDTIFFLQKDYDCYGIDSCKIIIDKNNMSMSDLKQDSQTYFMCLDIKDQNLMASLNHIPFDSIYSRFFLHAINDEEQNAFFKFLSSLKKDTMIFLEFRTKKDPLFLQSTNIEGNLGKTDHYRKFIDFEATCDLIKARDFTILHADEKDNLSIVGNDNPVLGRIIARKI